MCDSTGHDDPTTYDLPPTTDITVAGIGTVPSVSTADLYGTGQGIKLGSQVVVVGMGMGTNLGACPANLPDHISSDFLSILIEGDRVPTCFPRELVTLYADIYTGLDAIPPAMAREWDTENDPGELADDIDRSEGWLD